MGKEEIRHPFAEVLFAGCGVTLRQEEVAPTPGDTPYASVGLSLLPGEGIIGIDPRIGSSDSPAATGPGVKALVVGEHPAQLHLEVGGRPGDEVAEGLDVKWLAVERAGIDGGLATVGRIHKEGDIPGDRSRGRTLQIVSEHARVVGAFMHLAPGLEIGFVRKGRVIPIHLACMEGMIVNVRSPVSLGWQVQAVLPKTRIGVPALFGDQADRRPGALPYSASIPPVTTCTSCRALLLMPIQLGATNPSLLTSRTPSISTKVSFEPAIDALLLPRMRRLPSRHARL